MEVTDLPIPPSLRTKLQAAGYYFLHTAVSPVQLAQDVMISPTEALDVLKLVPFFDTFKCTPCCKVGHTAWDMYCNEQAKLQISTSCKELDDILGGGIGSKEMIEISGDPGAGKTQLGIQLSVNVQIPLECNGVGGHAVYIDTEGSFMVERVIQITESCISNITNRATSGPQADVPQSAAKLRVDTFLSHIYYFRVHSASEQIAVVNRMDKFLVEHSQVRLIVVDSVAFQFRQEFEDKLSRTRLLSYFAQKLLGIANKHELAIVIFNQITHKVTNDGSKSLPALGESWSHSSTSRLLLSWKDEHRYAFLSKSPSLPTRGTSFAVTSQGIQSVV